MSNTTSLLSSIHRGKISLTNANSTTGILNGIINKIGEGEFLKGYNKYRESHESPPIKKATFKRYSNSGGGYENGPPVSILVYGLHVKQELNLKFKNLEDEDFFTAPIEEVIERLSTLPQGLSRSKTTRNIIHPIEEYQSIPEGSDDIN